MFITGLLGVFCDVASSHSFRAGGLQVLYPSSDILWLTGYVPYHSSSRPVMRKSLTPYTQLDFWGGREDFFHLPFVANMFLSSSQWVPNLVFRFPMCSPRVFPVAPQFNPLCFAQCFALLTYISRPKGEALHLSVESFILGSLHSFNFFFLQWANQIVSLQPKKKKKLDF